MPLFQSEPIREGVVDHFVLKPIPLPEEPSEVSGINDLIRQAIRAPMGQDDVQFITPTFPGMPTPDAARIAGQMVVDRYGSDSTRFDLAIEHVALVFDHITNSIGMESLSDEVFMGVARYRAPSRISAVLGQKVTDE